MPKVSVYMPDELLRLARARGLSLSELTQRAVERALAEGAVSQWVADVRARPVRRPSEPVDTTALMDAVRDELGG